MAGADIGGKWTYRSFNNDPALVGNDGDKALRLIFAEAIFNFEIVSPTELKGTIDWEGGGLDLKGLIQPADATESFRVKIIGTGRPGTGTAGWEYDYDAGPAYTWPNGVKQVPALVGSVIRAKPHGASPAGYVASFVAVKH
ncbi:hypothetical protein [Bradyrhizobium sp. S69]|uniref:hypothetical protein n=1 Tax=Bradyrhizobium sp. S69 TaxID=1641856 RepID=UPI00131BFC48|nr:hypothetical protein [Bradyrhizobium sp. S69]